MLLLNTAPVKIILSSYSATNTNHSAYDPSVGPQRLDQILAASTNAAGNLSNTTVNSTNPAGASHEKTGNLPSLGISTVSHNPVNTPGAGPVIAAHSHAPNTPTSLSTSTTPASKKQTISVATPSSTIYDRNLNRRTPEVSISALSFLFAEIVSNCHENSKGISQLENKLNILGYSIGPRILELSYLRENQTQSNTSLKKLLKKNIKIIEILQFVYSTIWKNLFGKTADDLEKSQNMDNEYMIIDNDPVISQFISVPKDMKHLNCCAFVAGIVEGLLDSAYFLASVTAHNVPKDGFPLRTVYLVKFDDVVVERENVRFS